MVLTGDGWVVTGGELTLPTLPTLTPETSTPVRAEMAGGKVPQSLLTSWAVLSCPPIITISSVLASGADTSAAIWKWIFQFDVEIRIFQLLAAWTRLTAHTSQLLFDQSFLHSSPPSPSHSLNT